eukprot:1152452-Pelagomonas_calceolata.AAC.1
MLHDMSMCRLNVWPHMGRPGPTVQPNCMPSKGGACSLSVLGVKDVLTKEAYTAEVHLGGLGFLTPNSDVETSPPSLPTLPCSESIQRQLLPVLRPA